MPSRWPAVSLAAAALRMAIASSTDSAAPSAQPNSNRCPPTLPGPRPPKRRTGRRTPCTEQSHALARIRGRTEESGCLQVTLGLAGQIGKALQCSGSRRVGVDSGGNSEGLVGVAFGLLVFALARRQGPRKQRECQVDAAGQVTASSA